DDEDDDMDIEADDDDEKEEHPAPADSVVVALPATDQAPSAEETEPFETNESAATPPPHPAYHVTARISIPALTSIFDWQYLDFLLSSTLTFCLANQANSHAGTSEVTNNAGTSQTTNLIASEEKDEEVELIFVPSAIKITEEKVESMTSSTNSKKEETFDRTSKREEGFLY
ncbi:hypothetical protein Tco_0029424, partial [Tanacetum coccineum]